MRRTHENRVRVRQRGNFLKIAIPIEKPKPSKTGKTILVASTHGVITTEVLHHGRPIVVVANAFIYPDGKA
jgi:hypothetical protein